MAKHNHHPSTIRRQRRFMSRQSVQSHYKPLPRELHDDIGRGRWVLADPPNNNVYVAGRGAVDQVYASVIATFETVQVEHGV